ncbi:hypothetical protein BRY73_08420 [Ochrobactrum sp. P6BS-III]|uniref:DUF6074 family protein n=1 Tax=unclassified Ochrobactrum TaxID=239106 RepID=UPI0009943CD3|nr:hypothetical protein [Ochrobactrum sp. P6BSIII]OOL18073.1 hypothetical protein BRY73_08420 [Ochrobactrum sp. P6BS-III]
MNAVRNFNPDELRDPWIKYYEISPPSGGPIPFPATRNTREIERAARAIISGRSPGVTGWLRKRVTELALLGVDKEAASREIVDLKNAIEACVVRIRLTDDAHAI